MTDQGQFLIDELKQRRIDMLRGMAKADDCGLRKIAGAVDVLTEILDDFEEFKAPVDG